MCKFEDLHADPIKNVFTTMEAEGAFFGNGRQVNKWTQKLI